MKTLAKSLLMAGLMATGASQATIVNLATNLDGDSEPFEIQYTEGFGTAAATLDTLSGEFAWLISFEGLTGPATLAHFHEGALETSGPVIIALNDPELVQLSAIGNVQGIFQGNTVLDENQVVSVLDGLWYINVHTELNPRGEIRGQLTVVDNFAPAPVPLPGAAWLFATGLAGLSAVARKRSHG